MRSSCLCNLSAQHVCCGYGDVVTVAEAPEGVAQHLCQGEANPKPNFLSLPPFD